PRCNGTTRIPVPGGDMTCSNCIGQSHARIGSRETPAAVGLEMQNIAMQLALRAWVLRSGAARQGAKAAPDRISADEQFERGCMMVGGKAVLRTRTTWQPALDHAAQFHPAWDRCSDIAQALHARNSLVMLGDWLDKPVSFVVCWTEGSGGTAQALRIAT